MGVHAPFLGVTLTTSARTLEMRIRLPTTRKTSLLRKIRSFMRQVTDMQRNFSAVKELK